MIQIVVGSNYGDCGKGHYVDYFASKHNPQGCLVVRYNGGCQAAHTVVVNNIRHVFSHFGSGTFAGHPTFLSSYFIVNPLKFLQEMEKLNKLGYNPRVYISNNCLITTPYDVLLNQLFEYIRKNKHGSCGMGINETILRSNIPEYKLTVGEISTYTLEGIRTSYVFRRIKDIILSLLDVPDEYISFLEDKEVINKFMDDYYKLLSLTTMVLDSNTMISSYRNIIFEGAQGLLLDKDNTEFFPYLTPSNTGLTNVNKLLPNDSEIEAIYITRSYMTRHGAGPLSNEIFDVPAEFIDDTNITNKYQGSLRFAPLDIDLMIKHISKDLAKTTISKRISFGISCLDQTKDKMLTTKGKLTVEQFKDTMKNHFDVYKVYTSYGNSRDKIKE